MNTLEKRVVKLEERVTVLEHKKISPQEIRKAFKRKPTSHSQRVTKRDKPYPDMVWHNQAEAPDRLPPAPPMEVWEDENYIWDSSMIGFVCGFLVTLVAIYIIKCV